MSVLTIIAVICGIAVPILAKSIAEARSVVAKQSLAAAEQAIDMAMLDGSNVDVASLKQSFSRIQWLEYEGQDLKDCKRFWEEKRSSVYVTRLHGGALCIFAIPTDDSLVYSIYSDGAWHKGEKTEHSANFQAFIASLK
jgi:type II secretory pathway pseudopilin PulG